MNNEQVDKHFSCLICYELADRAVEGQCCGVLMCQSCYQNHRKKSTTCPICAKQNYKTHESYKLRIIINNLLVQCRAGCGAKIQNKSRMIHQKICKMMKQIFKNGGSVSQFTFSLFQIWKFYKFESLNSKSVQIQAHQCMIQKSIINILTNIKQINADKTLCQKFLLSLEDKCNDLYFCLILIYYEQRRYYQAIQWYIRAFSRSISPKFVFLANQVFTLCIYSMIEKKEKLGQLQKLIFQFSNTLNPQKQSHFIANSICLKLLAKLANILNACDRQLEYIVMLSNMEDKAYAMCVNIYQRACWFACLHHQLIALNDEKLKDQIQQVSFEITSFVKLMKTLVISFGKEKLFLDIILEKSEQILRKQLFQSFEKKINPKLAANSLIEIIQTAFLYECKTYNQNKLAHIDTVFCHSLIALQLFLYSVFHYKFRKLEKSSEIIHEKLEQMFNILNSNAKGDENLVQNIVNNELMVFKQQVDTSKVLKEKIFQFKLISLIKRYIARTLMITNRQNINLQNQVGVKIKIAQLQLSIYPKNCQDGIVLKFCSHFYTDCLISQLKEGEEKHENSRQQSSLSQQSLIKQFSLQGKLGEDKINQIIEKSIVLILNQRRGFSSCTVQNKNPFVLSISDKIFSVQRIRSVLTNYSIKLKSNNKSLKHERKFAIIKEKNPQKVGAQNKKTKLQMKTEQKKLKKSVSKDKKVQVTQRTIKNPHVVAKQMKK